MLYAVVVPADVIEAKISGSPVISLVHTTVFDVAVAEALMCISLAPKSFVVATPPIVRSHGSLLIVGGWLRSIGFLRWRHVTELSARETSETL